MSTTKEIKVRIGSVENTKKITRAMEMIAASKLKKARGRMEATKPYAEIARKIIGHLAMGHPEYNHPYLIERKVKRVGHIVVSTDRGLCGGLNLRLFKEVLGSMHEWQQKNIDIDVAIIGNKALPVFKHTDANVTAFAHHLGGAPQVKDLIGAVKVMLDAYGKEKIDRLYLASNEFTSTMKQTPQILQLLPLVPDKNKKLDYYWDYIYEPEAKTLLTMLLTRYIESQVYQGVIENLACEQAARMVAMKSATDNSNDLIKSLKLDYNKARQAAITTEIAEIVSGSIAVED